VIRDEIWLSLDGVWAGIETGGGLFTKHRRSSACSTIRDLVEKCLARRRIAPRRTIVPARHLLGRHFWASARPGPRVCEQPAPGPVQDKSVVRSSWPEMGPRRGRRAPSSTSEAAGDAQNKDSYRWARGLAEFVIH
jgi:hypothetical protein